MNTRHPQTQAVCRGFTLLEMMVALALMAILMSITVPTYAGFAARHRLAAASDMLALDLRQARLDAVQRGAALHVVAMAGAQWCYAVSTEPGCDCRSVNASCAIRRVDSSEFGGVVLNSAQAVSFDGRLGRSSGASVARFSVGGEFGTAVRVHASGRASVCTTGSAMSGYRPC